MKKTAILLVIIVMAVTATAQDGITLHFMRMNPYSQYSSPSAFLPYNGHVGMPALSNINVAATNTNFHYKTLFGTNDEGTITTIKLNDFADKLDRKYNALNTNISLNIIDFGFRVSKLYFSVGYRIRMDEYLTYNKDLFALPIHGNMSYANAGKAATPELRLTMNAYQELSVGIQAEVTPRIYIGVRPKILFGIAHARTKAANASLITDPEDYSLRINYALDASTSCIIPYTINLDTNGKPGIEMDPDAFLKDWQSAFKNVGAAIDLGFTYRINNMFGVSASVLDLGFIRWKTNNYRIQGSTAESGPYYNDGSFIFNGLSKEDIEQLSDDPEAFEKKVLGYFPLDANPTSAYTHMISGRFLVEGYCNLSKYHRFSALFQGRIVNKQFIPSFTVAWNGNFLRIFDLCVSYTLSRRSYGNLGVGVGFNLGVFHIYAVTDNILAIAHDKNTPISLMSAKNANIQMGIVFDWGKVKEKKLKKDKFHKIVVDNDVEDE